MNSNKIIVRDYKGISPSGERFGSFLVFLIWPFLGVIFSFINYKFKNSRNIIWFYNIFVGLTFNFASGSDSNRYRDELAVIYMKRDYTFSEFWKFLTGDGSNAIDILQPLINFFVSRFTPSPYILFGCYGLVFGYFYSRNIWFLIDKVKGKIKIEALAFLIMFSFLVPFWQINGFRYWTATHIFFFGLIRYYNNRKSLGLFFILGSTFMHYTYILGVGLFLLQQILGNRLKLYLYVYVISIFFTFVDLAFVNQYLELLPGNVQNRTKTYVNEDYAEEVFKAEESANWYIQYRYTMLKILVGGSFFWIFFFRRAIVYSNELMLNLFCIGLIFMAFGNITSSIPSMLRFFYIGYMATGLMLFMFFQIFPFRRRPDWYKFISLFIVIISSLVELRVGFENMTISSLISNIFTFGYFKDGGGVCFELDKVISL